MQVKLGSRRTLPTVEGAFCTGNVLPLLCMMPLFPHAIGELCSSPASSSSCKQSSLKRQRMGRAIERRPAWQIKLRKMESRQEKCRQEGAYFQDEHLMPRLHRLSTTPPPIFLFFFFCFFLQVFLYHFVHFHFKTRPFFLQETSFPRDFRNSKVRYRPDPGLGAVQDQVPFERRNSRPHKSD